MNARPGSRRPTIIDVARAAGVSKSLVSAALRGDAGVSSASRDLIVKTAHDLGYRTNAWAQRLVSGQSDLIGVLLTDLRNPYQTDIVNGIEDAATEAGLRVILNHGRRDRELLQQRLGELVELGVDAVIAVTGHLTESDLRETTARVPLVVVGRPNSVPEGAGWVHTDDETGARLAVTHLVEQGHTRIAFLTGSDRPASLARRDAFRTATPAPGSEFDARAGGISALLDAVMQPDGPTAVFAVNDRLATELLAEAIDRGISVPHDLAIIGYDNTELAELMRPGITSIDQPRAHMGRSAVAQTRAILAGQPAVHEVSPPALVVRGSTITSPEPQR